MSRARRLIGLLIGLAALAFAFAPAVRGAVEIPTREHHLLHGAILLLAVASGLFVAGRGNAARTAGGSVWLLASIFAPLFAMLLMWPSEYSYFETHPMGHVLEHLGLIALGFITAYSGQSYASGIGWASGLSLLAMAFLAAWGFGIAPPTTGAVATSSTAAQSAVAHSGDVHHGAVVYAQNCAACHGREGEGGAGPSLHNEARRKNLAQAQTWIEDPLPPMPKLYPGTLSAQDVADVAAFIESLR